jgi:hypothetical protein
MVCAQLAAFEVFFHRNGNTTHDGFGMLHSGHTLGNAAGVKDIFCRDVEADGNGAATALMRAVTGDFVILRSVHGVDLLNSFDDLL